MTPSGINTTPGFPDFLQQRHQPQPQDLLLMSVQQVRQQILGTSGPQSDKEPMLKTTTTDKLKWGVRGWKVSQEFDGQKLVYGLRAQFIMGPGTFPPYEVWEAECLSRSVEGRSVVDHIAPQPDCSCGFYASHPAIAERVIGEYVDNSNQSGEQSVFGEVWGWGGVVVCETGFRAQYTYPKAIWDTSCKHLDKAMLAEIAETYGVPLEAIREDQRKAVMAASCHEFRAVIAPEVGENPMETAYMEAYQSRLAEHLMRTSQTHTATFTTDRTYPTI